MSVPTLANVFADAALPQKRVFVLLLAALPLTVVAAVMALRGGPRANLWRLIVHHLRLPGIALGTFVAGLNSFHMGQTIERLPFEPTLKQVAPGVLEAAALISLGALVALTATMAHVAIGLTDVRRRTR